MARLAKYVESIQYVHAKDGKRYRHEFETPVRADVRPGKKEVVLTSDTDKDLARVFDMPKTGPQLYLINQPPTARPRKQGGVMARKRHRRRRSGSHKRRSHALTVARRNPPRRRRHHVRMVHRRRGRVRRNPPMGSLTRAAVQGVKDAALITVGQVANRSLLKMLPALPATWSAQMQSTVATLVQAAGAVAVGYASALVLSKDNARYVLAGAMASALQNGIKIAVPSAAPLLGDYPGFLYGYARMNGYARAPLSGYGPRALVASAPAATTGDYATDAQGLGMQQ